jgi:hypothetical protein
MASSTAILEWNFDPNDPRAPTADVWDRMNEYQRARVLDTLPSEFEPSEQFMPEGDLHYETLFLTREALRRHFGKLERRIYVAANMAVYYPGEAMFSPDVFAVLDVAPLERLSWNVSREGKGLDLALEIRVAGSRHKDTVKNVSRYAQLGIREYFVCELPTQDLKGYRLAGTVGGYTPMLPHRRRMHSKVLGLELAIEDGRLRFFYADASLPYTDELIARLDAAVEQADRRLQEEVKRAELRLQEEAARAQRALLAEQRAELRLQEEAARAELRLQEETERARTAEQRLAEALAELERLRSNKTNSPS